MNTAKTQARINQSKADKLAFQMISANEKKRFLARAEKERELSEPSVSSCFRNNW